MAELLTSCWQLLGIVIAVIGIIIALITLYLVVTSVILAVKSKKDMDERRKKD